LPRIQRNGRVFTGNMTYARARLWLGISGVGTLVFLATLAWVYRLSWTFFPFDGSVFADTAALWTFYFAFALVSFYFDVMGGYWLPCKFGRLCVNFPVFLMKWLRGVSVQGSCMVASALLILQAGRLAGLWGAVAALLAIQFLLLLLQARLAKLAGGLSPLRDAQLQESGPRVEVWGALDGGFSGGLAGLPGRETVVVPEHWHRALPENALRAELLRRTGILSTGSRTLGVLVAVAWNTAGFILASQVPGAGVTRVAELVQTILGCTLWNFLGLLILPSLSRGGVLAADRWASERGTDFATLYTLIRELDQWQDDEPVRKPWIERIFHPIPSVETRLNALQTGRSASGAWHAARLALFLSWASFGLLSRAVHCNSGRPELWVLLPSD
jgi:hypothetical protein